MRKKYLRGCIILLMIGNVLFGTFLFRQQQLEIAHRNWIAQQIFELAPEQAGELVPLLFEKIQYSKGNVLENYGYTADGFYLWAKSSGEMSKKVGIWMVGLMFSAGFGWFLLRGVKEEKEELEILSQCMQQDREPVSEEKESSVAPCWEALRKLREREIALKDYCEEELRKARVFVENVAHQVKTPLCGIQLTGETVLRYLSGEESLEEKEVKGLLKESLEENQRLQELLVRLMKIGRLEAGKVFLEQERLSLSDMIVQIRDHLKIHGDWEIHGDTSYWGDYEWLREAFYNLLSNCKEYGDQIDIRLQGDKEYISVDVSDNGCGIPAEEFPKVLECFYTSSNSTYFHMGIGLNLTKEIIEAHQGVIQVRNSEDGGALFHMVFPRFQVLK